MDRDLYRGRDLGQGRLTVLLLGSDKFNSSCNNRGDLGGERTDTIMFATINPQTGRVALASLPRDTIQLPSGTRSMADRSHPH